MNRIMEMNVRDANKSEGKLHLYDGYFCTECNNKGLIFEMRGEELVSYLCKCRKIRKNLRILKESGLSSLIEKKTFDNFYDNEEWQKNLKMLCCEFLDQSDNKTFYIGGQCGCGKTHLCTAMCAHYISKGLTTRYLVWPNEAKTLKGLLNTREYNERINQFINADVLYIDDFLKQKQGSEPSSADLSIAFELLNARIIAPERITIISSEYTYDALLPLDQGTISRIAEMSGKYLLSISPDIRKNFRLPRQA